MIRTINLAVLFIAVYLLSRRWSEYQEMLRHRENAHATLKTQFSAIDDYFRDYVRVDSV